MQMTPEDYKPRLVIQEFRAIGETQKEVEETTLIPKDSIVEARARFNKTDEEWIRFNWNNANYRVLETIFRTSTKPVPVESKS